jgi:hypothetical protein
MRADQVVDVRGVFADAPRRRGCIRLQGRDFGVRFGKPNADVDDFRRAQPTGLGFE